LHAGLGLLAGGVDLDVDVEGPSGGVGLEEDGAAGVELGGFLEGVDRGDAEEVGDLGGEGFALV
jgi:hypothetical protein